MSSLVAGSYIGVDGRVAAITAVKKVVRIVGASLGAEHAMVDVGGPSSAAREASFTDPPRALSYQSPNLLERLVVSGESR